MAHLRKTVLIQLSRDESVVDFTASNDDAIEPAADCRECVHESRRRIIQTL